MNTKTITFIKNFSFTLSSNLISLAISAIVILIVPKLLGVEEYGYWQLYLFYSSYVGFLHFGWNDGIYLRYGGKEYKQLNKELFFSQFWMLVAFQTLIGLIIIYCANIFSTDTSKLYIINMTALCMFIVNIRYMLIYLLQGTNRIKEDAQIKMLEKVLYCLLIIFFLLLGIREYKLLIIADIIGKLISLGYAIFCCRDIVFKKLSSFHMNFIETYKNINVGIKLMFANIASMLIIGIVRFGIEHTWDVSIFGKISLILNISSFVMIFINAVGLVLYPVLRRTNMDKLSSLYINIRTLLMFPLLGILLVFFPMKVFLSAWLPQYADSFVFMAIIFPMCVYEGKMGLLINTYLKTLRKERVLLVINLITVVLSIIFTVLFTVVLKNLLLAILSIVLLLAIRCAFGEILLSKTLNISVYKDILLEMLFTLIFIIIGLFITSIWLGVSAYLAGYLIYLVIKGKEIKESVLYIKKLVQA
ncbi:MATE family efflux transporter [Niallia endozanthoxylica]|uniref:Polysaccharide biosynthesis protein n=1 Tax=Niallia endozanthoxylica TaxID=2036016 RepID=A0A5J5GZY1_9BACI|nr:hypothetical protein [Niallia endozanthoxylica]KAA9013820.1 hypothetical protein F4V44_24455 [Niallia endozanthoxylica]